MARPFQDEMEQLRATFAWAASTDVSSLQRSVKEAANLPLRAIGSGGSLTAAHALATFHQEFARNLSAVATPLEVTSQPLTREISAWLISARGGNVDIVSAADNLIVAEPRQLVMVCGKEDSPLGERAAAHPYVDWHFFPPPAGKDGFLATNSLLGFIALFARAYATVFGAEEQWLQTESQISSLLLPNSPEIMQWHSGGERIFARPTTLVLHGHSTRIGAIDLESKFTEAALGNLQIADFRNFAHGRHHWLAKHGNESSVIAFVTEVDKRLAERTLALIPAEIPKKRFDLPASPTAAALASTIAAFHLTGQAGIAKGIDPGRPGVPEFGRRLYNLKLPSPRKKRAAKVLTDREQAVLARKVGGARATFADAECLARWKSYLDEFRTRLSSGRFVGVALDYDGTVVDTRDRFAPPKSLVSEQLSRLARVSQVAIATGRGKSVRKDLQACLPRDLWERVLLGYYNGGEIGFLNEDNIPDGRTEAGESLRPIAQVLHANLSLGDIATQCDRRFQITLEAKKILPEGQLWEVVRQILARAGLAEVEVMRSSHSVDIVAPRVSKLNVISRMQSAAGGGGVLCIGDRGRWPGNDVELLATPYSLSVDEVSIDEKTCWNLSLPGQRGTAATLEILKNLEFVDGTLQFKEGAFE